MVKGNNPLSDAPASTVGLRQTALYCFVVSGRAAFVGHGLRCRAPRPNDSNRPCNKLMAKENGDGLIAGAYKCERCGEMIEVAVKDHAHAVEALSRCA